MAVSVSSADFERTLLTATRRIVTGVGETAPSTVAGAQTTVLRAIDAVNDAQDEIYSRSQWDFRYDWVPIDLVDSHGWYDLPEDFGEAATDIPIHLGDAVLEYVPFRDVLKMYPRFRLFPIGSGANISVVAQAVASAEQFGTPLLWSILNDQLLLYPAPNAAWVTAQVQIFMGYYRQPAVLIADGDLLDLPKNLWPAHYHLSLAYLKQHLEYADFQADEQRAERKIRLEMNRRTKKGRTNHQFRVTAV